MGNANTSRSHAALWWLAQSGNADELQKAIQKVPPKLKHSYLEHVSEIDNSTPLVIAVHCGHVECVRILLVAGVNANRNNIVGLSPLHVAVKANNPKIVQLLVENTTVNCNAVDQRGYTPLLAAAVDGHSQALNVLLHCGAVDLFAYKGRSRNDVLALTRRGYAKADGVHLLKLKACLDLISTRLVVRSGSLYEFTSSGTSGAWMWTRRRYAILRTANPAIVKIELFPQSGRTLSKPSSEMTWQCSQTIRESTVLGLATLPSSFSERQFRFALRVRVTGKRATEKIIALAAENQEGLRVWKDLPRKVRMAQRGTVNETRTRRSLSEPQPEQGLLDEQEAQRLRQMRQEEQEDRQFQEQLERAQGLSMELALQQQRDLERAIQLSASLSGASVGPTSSPSSPDEVRTTPASEPEAPTDCIICYDAARCAVCVPCGHVAMCMNCAKQVKSTKRVCPVCRSQVSDIIKIFHV